MSGSILIVAGESSGDLHSAPVVASMKTEIPDLSFFGAGGENMRAESVELIEHINDLAVMGISGVPRLLPRLSRLRKRLIKRVEQEAVKLAILTDYPGFNLSLAKSLKQLSRPPRILSYIAPQVWAWRAGRIRKMKSIIDHLAVVFPFEVDIFKSGGIDTTFVGHPLLDDIAGYIDHVDGHGESMSSMSDSQPLLALLPGSREQEVKRHLKLMAEAAIILRTEIPGLRIGIGVASTIGRVYYEKFIRGYNGLKLFDDSRDLIRQADFAAVCSGTATLETALIGTPMVVVYRTSMLNYNLLKPFIKLDKVALANIVAGKEIVPELIQRDFTKENLTVELKKIINDQAFRKKTLDEMLNVRQLLGERGASKKVARIALNMLKTEEGQ